MDEPPLTSEQQRELQKQQCIFCQIAGGRVTSKSIYEDEKVMAILDINPANPGHVIVFPKEHYPLLPMMPSHAVEYLFRVVKKISRAQIASLKADGNNVFVASGSSAGQKATHVVIHLIPRKDKDGIDCFKYIQNDISPADQESLRKAIHEKVVKYFGMPDEEFEPYHKGGEEPAQPVERPEPARPPAPQGLEQPEGSRHAFVVPPPDVDQYPESTVGVPSTPPEIPQKGSDTVSPSEKTSDRGVPAENVRVDEHAEGESEHPEQVEEESEHEETEVDTEEEHAEEELEEIAWEEHAEESDEQAEEELDEVAGVESPEDEYHDLEEVAEGSDEPGHKMFEVPPPEIHEDDDEMEPDPRLKKKKVNLDKIAGLFK